MAWHGRALNGVLVSHNESPLSVPPARGDGCDVTGERGWEMPAAFSLSLWEPLVATEWTCVGRGWEAGSVRSVLRNRPVRSHTTLSTLDPCGRCARAASAIGVAGAPTRCPWGSFARPLEARKRCRGRRLFAGSVAGWRQHGCRSSRNPEATPAAAGYGTRGRPLAVAVGRGHARLRHPFAPSRGRGIPRGALAAPGAGRRRRRRGAESPAPAVPMVVSGAPEKSPIQRWPRDRSCARRAQRRFTGPRGNRGGGGISARWGHVQFKIGKKKTAVAAGRVPTRTERSRGTGPAKAAARGERSYALGPELFLCHTPAVFGAPWR